GPVVLVVVGGEGAVRGRASPPQVRVVHHVVVEQGGRLEKLHRARGADQAGGVLAAQRAVTPVEEGGAQPLAARQERGDLVDEVCDLVAELGQDLALVGQVLI